MRLILASASPRRADLLTAAGYAFEVHAVDVDERQKKGEGAIAYVQRLATAKSARAIGEISGPAEAGHYVHHEEDYVHHEEDSVVVSGFSRTVSSEDELIVIGADTAVVVGDDILGKPHDVEDAARMLRRLSGRAHQVMTGLSIRSVTAEVAHVEISSVTFMPLTEDQIAWYVASGEGHDKAGGYAIQGLASRFIPRIEGSYSNVVGLPVAVVDGLIRRLSWPPSLLASRE